MPEDFPLVVESNADEQSSRNGSSLMQGTFNLVGAAPIERKAAACRHFHGTSMAESRNCWVTADQYIYGSWLTQHAICNAPECLPQVVIVPIVKKEADQAGVTQAVESLYAAAQRAGLRCKLNASTEKTPGWKFNHYEMKVLPAWHAHMLSVLVCSAWLFVSCISCPEPQQGRQVEQRGGDRVAG